ncbi:MAG: nitrogenase-stabilizing/protective protein NifW [Zoogloeaceae bacterium]|nr:nitrogenase-stabilizing/protective protein NifW [Rhodocyclaceae bacterium]MCP5235811.1 nitrogenase-stabilizing/protective protein NifW [Zoogloeaceae bacterium]
MIDECTLDDALDELESAEDFLTYFDVTFDPSIVQVSRLHILQRYHDYLAAAPGDDGDDEARRAVHRRALTQAYADFVHSTPLDEKVFKVFHMHEPQIAIIPVESLRIR